jgi:N-acyl-L-homoserine lactone synthetase
MHLLISSGEAAGEARALRSMFEARKRVFVDLLKWDVPVLAGRFEIDQFDDPHATYLILTDGEGLHLASTRLLPTLRPHILDSLFASLCDAPPPRSATTFEVTRFCLDRSLSARDRRAARDTLIVALVEHALAQGIDTYTAVADMHWFAQIPTFGWTCRPLGAPRSINGERLAAFAIEIDASTPERLTAAGIVATSRVGPSRLAA